MADTEYDVMVSVDETINADVGSTQIEGGLSIDEGLLSLSAESPDDIIVDANVNTTEALEVTAEENTGGTDDHRKLLHRDAQAQHPMTSIVGTTSSRTLADEISAINATLGMHTAGINTATTSAGNAMTTAQEAGAVANQAADDLDILTPIVGSNTTGISNLSSDITWTNAQLNGEIQYRIDGNLSVKTITNMTDVNGIELYTGSNKLQLMGDSIIMTRNGVAVAYIVADPYGSSYFKADNARISTLKMRSATGAGYLTWIAGSDNHLSLKAVQ